MILLTTVPVAIVTWIATANTRAAVEAEVVKSSLSRLLWADQYLDELTNQVESLFYSLQIDRGFMDDLAAVHPEAGELPPKVVRSLGERLKASLYAHFRKVDQLVLYERSSALTFTVDALNSGTSQPVLPSGPWKRMEAGPVNLYFLGSGSEIRAFHSINRFEDRVLLGGFSARINPDVLKEASGILTEPGSLTFLLNDQGSILAGASSEGIPSVTGLLAGVDWSRSDVESGQADGYLWFRKRSASGALALVKLVPLELVDRGSQTVFWTGLAAGAAFVLLSLGLSIVVSLRITRPLVRLTQRMIQAPIQGFEAGPVSGRDEISLLEQGYNTMMGRINELIEEEFRKDLDLKDAQLLALRAQIHPHFLNNTLQLISGMAQSRGVPEIHDIAKSIGSLLRYATGEGDTVTLEDEFGHTANYLHIQENRFAGRCSIRVVLEPGLEVMVFPKFSLQPIVENAFEHGLQRKSGAWSLDIEARSHRGGIVILVKDNGVGLGTEAARSIREALRKGGPLATRGDHSIGLANVHSRIRLRYGSPFGLRFFSVPGQGTLVYLVIPRLSPEGSP